MASSQPKARGHADGRSSSAPLADAWAGDGEVGRKDGEEEKEEEEVVWKTTGSKRGGVPEETTPLTMRRARRGQDRVEKFGTSTIASCHRSSSSAARSKPSRHALHTAPGTHDAGQNAWSVTR
jgi:hypothetical protein